MTLSLSHTISAFDTAPQPGFYVQCGELAPTSNNGLEGEIAWHPVIYNIATGETKDGLSDYDKPYAYSVAPGESTGLILYLNGSDRFQGDLQLTAQGNTQTQQVIPILSGDVPAPGLEWPGISKAFSVLVHPVEGRLYCVTAANPGLGQECAPAEIAILASAASAASGSAPVVPEEISGRWCTRGDQPSCFNVADKAKDYPSLVVQLGSPGVVPGTTAYQICFQTDDCSMAGSMFLTYFPTGQAWDCEAYVKTDGRWPACQPDYTGEHDTSQPRLLLIPNHQQSQLYMDSEPMYRVG